jgi:hypothetical protein
MYHYVEGQNTFALSICSNIKKTVLIVPALQGSRTQNKLWCKDALDSIDLPADEKEKLSEIMTADYMSSELVMILLKNHLIWTSGHRKEN